MKSEFNSNSSNCANVSATRGPNRFGEPVVSTFSTYNRTSLAIIFVANPPLYVSLTIRLGNLSIVAVLRPLDTFTTSRIACMSRPLAVPKAMASLVAAIAVAEKKSRFNLPLASFFKVSLWKTSVSKEFFTSLISSRIIDLQSSRVCPRCANVCYAKVRYWYLSLKMKIVKITTTRHVWDASI